MRRPPLHSYNSIAHIHSTRAQPFSLASQVASPQPIKAKCPPAPLTFLIRLPHHLPTNEEAVLLGAAILAATAGGAYPSVGYAAAAMTSVKETIYPSEDEQVGGQHDGKEKARREQGGALSRRPPITARERLRCHRERMNEHGRRLHRAQG